MVFTRIPGFFAGLRALNPFFQTSQAEPVEPWHAATHAKKLHVYFKYSFGKQE